MNLGALCRSAEVFRLQELVLSDLEVVTNREFRKLTASAYAWQPLTACAIADLPAWIRQQQHTGFAVLALTRHKQATPLPQFCFPKQTVLLLGRELTGIPETFIQQCNAVVDIPQFGYVESLNVSTAAAIAAYAYLCQHAQAS